MPGGLEAGGLDPGALEAGWLACWLTGLDWIGCEWLLDRRKWWDWRMTGSALQRWEFHLHIVFLKGGGVWGGVVARLGRIGRWRMTGSALQRWELPCHIVFKKGRGLERGGGWIGT